MGIWSLLGKAGSGDGLGVVLFVLLFYTIFIFLSIYLCFYQDKLKDFVFVYQLFFSFCMGLFAFVCCNGKRMKQVLFGFVQIKRLFVWTFSNVLVASNNEKKHFKKNPQTLTRVQYPCTKRYFTTSHTIFTLARPCLDLLKPRKKNHVQKSFKGPKHAETN